MLTIHFPSGETLEVQPAQGSRAVEQLLQPAFVEAQFALARWVEVPVGAWVELEGRRYTLYAPAAATRDGATLYDYRARFESEARGLEAIVALNPVDGRAAFPLTASPAEHAGLVVENMNARGGGGWRLGGCVEGAPKEISYDGTPCLAALGQIAEAFGTEWNCDGKVITIGRVGHGAEDPVPLCYGEGLKPGLQRTVHSEDGNPVGRLFVQGGERNVSFSDYGKKRLHLPKDKMISFDGLHFEGEAGFAAARGVRYLTDLEGTSVERADALPGVTYREATLALEECYPRREGTVTGVSADGLDFEDSTIPADLNYRDARIGGEKATIVFQSGMLAGREFDIVQTETDLMGYDHRTRRFELVPQDEDGVSMPGGVFVPRVGDRYAVFHINMPERYVLDAEEEMLRGAVRYLHPRAGHRFTVRAELDAAWARARWESLGGRLGLGGYVAIEDRELFGASGEGRAVLRVVEVSRPLGDPHAPTLTLSNEPAAGGIFTQLARARAQEQVVATRHAEAVRYTRRTFRQAKEGLKQLEDVAKRVDDFKESIKPATVITMGALVGSEATNFTFVNRVDFMWEGAGKRLRARAADGRAMVLEHATLGGEPQGRGTIGTTGATARRWNLYAFSSGALTVAGRPYFLYAECPSEAGKTDGRFAISIVARPLREGDRYNLLCALVSSEDGFGTRSVQPVFGVTEVTPGMVRTSRIVSRGGETYFDLEHGEIGGNIRFTIPEAKESSTVAPNPNLFSNGGPMIVGVEGWRVIPDSNDWEMRMEQVEEEAHGGYGRIRYTARRVGRSESHRYFKIGVVWMAVPLKLGRKVTVCMAVGLARCTHPKAVMFDGNFGGFKYLSKILPEMRRTSSLAGNISQADSPFARGRDEAAEAVVFGPLPRFGKGVVTSLSWFVDSDALPNKGLGEEVVLEFAWLKVEMGERFTGMPTAGLGGLAGGQGFTLVEGGRLRTFGLELMQGRGAGACTTAGLWGGGYAGAYSKNSPAFWAGGTFVEALRGLANTILRHDGSAKIGRMLVAQNGDMAWADNGDLFEINPTKNIPPIAKIDTIGKDEASEFHEFFRSLDERGCEIKPLQSRRPKENFFPFEQEVSFDLCTVRNIGDETVSVDIYITAVYEFNANAGGYEGDLAMVAIVFDGHVLMGGKKIELYGNAGDKTTDGRYRLGYTYRDKTVAKIRVQAKSYESISVKGKVHINLLATAGTINKHTSGMDLYGFNSNASIKVKNVKFFYSYRVKYESIKSQQKFIIARNGFCVFNSSAKYIYSNSETGEFIIKGAKIIE